MRSQQRGKAMRAIELEGATNVRDLGGIPVAGGRVVRRGLIYRGDALCKATAADVCKLSEELGVRCVVDVRCGWERTAKPDVAIPGADNLHIPFYDLEQVGIEYTRSIEGSVVSGHDIVCDPDDFYRAMPNPLTAGQMRAALDQIFSCALAGKPVYEHCSGGKDRAGILALLVLTVLGASREDILADYLLTNIGRDKNIQSTFARFKRLMGGDEEAAWVVTNNHRARPENLEAFYESVGQRYGGMEPFMIEVLGYSAQRCRNLRELLTEPAGKHE